MSSWIFRASGVRLSPTLTGSVDVIFIDWVLTLSLLYFRATTYNTPTCSLAWLEFFTLFNTTDLTENHSVHLRLLCNAWYG